MLVVTPHPGPARRHVVHVVDGSNRDDLDEFVDCRNFWVATNAGPAPPFAEEEWKIVTWGTLCPHWRGEIERGVCSLPEARGIFPDCQMIRRSGIPVIATDAGKGHSWRGPWPRRWVSRLGLALRCPRRSFGPGRAGPLVGVRPLGVGRTVGVFSSSQCAAKLAIATRRCRC